MYSIAELLMEAQPLPFSVTPEGDKWNFETEVQQFQLRMSLLQNGKRKPFKKQKGGAVVFSLWEIAGSKANQKVKRIAKPLNVVATIAEVVSNLLADNKMAETVFLRVPSTANVDAATRIAARYIKLKAQRWEVLGAVDDGTGMAYIAMAKKGTDAPLSQIFGEKTELTIRQFIEVDNEEEAQKLMAKGNAIIRRMISMDPELGSQDGEQVEPVTTGDEVEPVVTTEVPVVEPQPEPVVTTKTSKELFNDWLSDMIRSTIAANDDILTGLTKLPLGVVSIPDDISTDPNTRATYAVEAEQCFTLLRDYADAWLKQSPVQGWRIDKSSDIGLSKSTFIVTNPGFFTDLGKEYPFVTSDTVGYSGDAVMTKTDSILGIIDTVVAGDSEYLFGVNFEVILDAILSYEDHSYGSLINKFFSEGPIVYRNFAKLKNTSIWSKYVKYAFPILRRVLRNQIANGYGIDVGTYSLHSYSTEPQYTQIVNDAAAVLDAIYFYFSDMVAKKSGETSIRMSPVDINFNTTNLSANMIVVARQWALDNKAMPTYSEIFWRNVLSLDDSKFRLVMDAVTESISNELEIRETVKLAQYFPEQHKSMAPCFARFMTFSDISDNKFALSVRVLSKSKGTKFEPEVFDRIRAAAVRTIQPAMMLPYIDTLLGSTSDYSTELDNLLDAARRAGIPNARQAILHAVTLSNYGMDVTVTAVNDVRKARAGIVFDLMSKIPDVAGDYLMDDNIQYLLNSTIIRNEDAVKFLELDSQLESRGFSKAITRIKAKERREYGAELAAIVMSAMSTNQSVVDDWYANAPNDVKKLVSIILTGVDAVRKQLLDSPLPVHSVETGEITIDRVLSLLEFNDMSIDSIVSARKMKKGERLSEYLTSIQSDQIDMPELKITDDELSPDLQATLNERLLTYHAGKHGNVYPKLLRSFTVNLGNDAAYDKFLASRESSGNGEVLIPAFHGTGGLAANMILRNGFTVVPESAAGVTSRMLGDGIYFTNAIDKATQYVGNDGYSRGPGTMGYMFEAKVALGRDGVDYTSAGTGKNDGIVSPEWCVYDAPSQVVILKAYEVELQTGNEVVSHIASLKKQAGINECTSFKQFMTEAKIQSVPDVTEFIFSGTSGKIPVRIGNRLVDLYSSELTLTGGGFMYTDGYTTTLRFPAKKTKCFAYTSVKQVEEKEFRMLDALLRQYSNIDSLDDYIV